MEFNYYEKLKGAYLNEVNCPELLPYEVEIVHIIGTLLSVILVLPASGSHVQTPRK